MFFFPAAVGVVVVFGARFFVGFGACVAFTGAGVLLMLPFVLVVKARGGAGTVAR